MLRRKPDNTFEYRHLEFALGSSRPLPLTPQRREALRLRIMTSLGPQDAQARRGIALREHWVAVPATIGVAAAIFGALHFAPFTDQQDATVVMARSLGDILVNGQPADRATADQEIRAQSFAWVAISDAVRVGMDPGSSISFQQTGDLLTIVHHSGSAVFVTQNDRVRLIGTGWTAEISADSAFKSSKSGGVATLLMEEGSALVSASGHTYSLVPGSGPLLVPEAFAPTNRSSPGSPGNITPTAARTSTGDTAPAAAGSVPGAESPAPAGVGSNGIASGDSSPAGSSDSGHASPTAPAPAQPVGEHDSAVQAPKPVVSSGAPASPPAVTVNPPADSPPTDRAGGAGGPPADPPGNSGNAPGQSIPPGNSGDAPGHSTPPGKSGDAPGQSTPPGKSGNAPGQSTPPGNSGIAPGQSSPPANSADAPGQSAPPGNSANAPGHNKEPAALNAEAPVDPSASAKNTKPAKN
ncbi:MAG: hypothetical protein ABIQ47_04495 [Tepidiformaceae bacterium]